MASIKIQYSAIKLHRCRRTLTPVHGMCFSLAVVILAQCGCQQMPGSQAMRQYQLESDRLVNEFRAQKKRAEELETRNAQLEQRLAESEKQLAKSSTMAGRRNGRSNQTADIMIGESNNDLKGLSDSGSTRAMSKSSSMRNNTGLPDMSPGTNSRFTSGALRDPISLSGVDKDLRGDRNSPSQWRPITPGNK